MKLILASFLIAASVHAYAADTSTDTNAQASKANGGLLKDFDTLGGNDVLLDKARELNPDARISVVQNRVVNLRSRVEVAPEFVSVFGGDPYNHTNGFALNGYYHFTPHIAIGAKYEYDTNSIRPEGQALINQAVSEGNLNLVPFIDAPKSQILGFVNWAPIYGKLNFFDKGVVHFDVYATAGGGQVTLQRSGGKGTYTAGAGVAFWFSQHLSTRAELRYQTYDAQKNLAGDSEKMNLTVGSLQVGYLL